jgi:hypothetical protein
MKPIEFKEHNKVYAKDQEEYIDLPVYENELEVFHCWELSLRERVKLLLTGKLWINVLNHRKPLQPIRAMVCNPFKQLAN